MNFGAGQSRLDLLVLNQRIFVVYNITARSILDWLAPKCMFTVSIGLKLLLERSKMVRLTLLRRQNFDPHWHSKHAFCVQSAENGSARFVADTKSKQHQNVQIHSQLTSTKMHVYYVKSIKLLQVEALNYGGAIETPSTCILVLVNHE